MKKMSKKARDKECMKWADISRQLRNDRSEVDLKIARAFEGLPKECAYERGQAALLSSMAWDVFERAMRLAITMNEAFYDEEE